MNKTTLVLIAGLLAGAASAQSTPAPATPASTAPQSAVPPEVAKAQASHEKEAAKSGAKDGKKAGDKAGKKAKKAAPAKDKAIQKVPTEGAETTAGASDAGTVPARAG